MSVISGPRGFVGMGVGGPPGARPMAPRGPPTQPRPLMDFGEQMDGTAYLPDQMHMQVQVVDINRMRHLVV